MFVSNENLLKRWSRLVPTTDGNGVSVPVVVDWRWGELVLVPGQTRGGWYYVYRRESVQGRFAVVKLDGLKVLCTSQTLKGGIAVCEELNRLYGMARLAGCAMEKHQTERE